MTNTNSNFDHNFGTDLGTALMRTTSDNVQMSRMENEMARSMGMQDVPSSSGAKEIEIAQLHLSMDIQVRISPNPLVITEYAKLMAQGILFQPVTVFFDGDVYWLSDGFYRVQAALQAGKTHLSAIVKQGGAREATLFAIENNRSHGVRLTTAEKRRAILRLLADSEWSQWSNREIGDYCGASEGMVRKYRSTTENTQKRRYKRGGKTHVMDITRIGTTYAEVSSSVPRMLAIARRLDLIDDPAQMDVLTSLPAAVQRDVLKIMRAGQAKSVADARLVLRQQNQKKDKANLLQDRRKQAEIAGFDNQFVHGDCTEVLGGLQANSVRLLLADGPYGVNYSNGNRVATAASAKISNDACLADALDVHSRMLKAIEKAMQPDCHVLLFCDKKFEPEFRKVAADAGYQWQTSLIWYKGSNGRPIRDQASRCYETILWFTKGHPRLVETINDVLEFARPSSDPDAPETSHSTPKPVSLMAKLISATTVLGELVVDPFAGQASTLVAAKSLGRHYFGVEEDKNWFGEGQANLQENPSDRSSNFTLPANSYQGETEMAA